MDFLNGGADVIREIALNLATQQGYTGIIELLKSYGAGVKL